MSEWTGPDEYGCMNGCARSVLAWAPMPKYSLKIL